jgi:hypothetical protein
MKDLDFDELDRAVNSLIGGGQGQTDDAKEDTGTSATASVSDVPTPESTPASIIPDINTPAPQPLAARRSSGRFMDVVHPSSDMRGNFVPPRPSTREGTTIQPTSSSFVDEPVMSTPSPDVSSPQEVATPEPIKSEWPDPIDYDKSSNQPAAETEQTPSVVLNDEPTPVADDEMPPLESPFITDAKVEKRPLGAFTNEPTAPAAETVPPEVPASEPDIDLSTNVEDDPNNETPMPAELQDNLLSIESSEDTAETQTNDKTTPIPTMALPMLSSANETTGPVAITQQYVEQPSTGDKPAGSIFDVDNYHKPIAHPKKNKSGWLMVVWIVLLIIFGIGAGAAFYFYILPTL